MREVNKLKASDVSTLGDGKHADGQGLYLHVKGDARSWVFRYKRNGKQDPKFMRDYSSPKRAMNAIREIVRCAGFEW